MNNIAIRTTLEDVRKLALKLMNTHWDFEDLHGLPRSINIVKDFKYTFKFDFGKVRFGCCAAYRENAWADTQRWISLSKPLCSLNLDKFDSKIKDTILHEIAHALTIVVNPNADSHGRLWQHIAKQIGCDARQYYDSSDNITMPKSKYTLICPNCKEETSAYKKLKRKRACVPCCTEFNGGRFSYDYELKVVQNY